MHANTSIHGVTKVTRGPIVQFTGSGTYHSEIKVECGPDSRFALDLFAPTYEALVVMQDEFLSPRQIDEVTR